MTVETLEARIRYVRRQLCIALRFCLLAFLADIPAWAQDQQSECKIDDILHAEFPGRDDGTGMLMGGCATLPADSRVMDPVVPEPYRGFRVVRVGSGETE